MIFWYQIIDLIWIFLKYCFLSFNNRFSNQNFDVTIVKLQNSNLFSPFIFYLNSFTNKSRILISKLSYSCF